MALLCFHHAMTNFSSGAVITVFIHTLQFVLFKELKLSQLIEGQKLRPALGPDDLLCKVT